MQRPSCGKACVCVVWVSLTAVSSIQFVFSLDVLCVPLDGFYGASAVYVCL